MFTAYVEAGIKMPAPQGLMPFSGSYKECGVRIPRYARLEGEQNALFNRIDALCERIDMTDDLHQQVVDAAVRTMDVARTALRKIRRCPGRRGYGAACTMAIRYTRAVEEFLNRVERVVYSPLYRH